MRHNFTPEFQAYLEQPKIDVHNVISLLAMVKAGLGITVLPSMTVNSNPAEIAFCPIRNGQVLSQKYVLHRTGDRISPAMAE